MTRFSSLRTEAILTVSFILGMIAPGAILANTTTDEIGFSPNHVFASLLEGEYVDVMTGNVALTLPLGPSYELHPNLDFQLTARYNATVWEYDCPGELDQVNCEGELRTTGTYGLGWRLDLGTIRHDSDDFANVYRLSLPSGGDQVFCDDLESYLPDATSCSTRTTVDPSSVHTLKIGSGASATWEASFPDGKKVVFGHKLADAWYATEIVARSETSGSAAKVVVSYLSGTDKIDKIELEVPSDPVTIVRTVNFTYGTNDVTISFPSFAGSEAVSAGTTSSYVLHLASDLIESPNDNPLSANSKLLTGVDLPTPAGSPTISHGFTYTDYGSIQRWTLPTGAYAEYYYKYYKTDRRPWQTDMWGRELTADGVTRRWTYDRFGDGIVRSWQDINTDTNPVVSFSNPHTVHVLDPAQNLTVYRFHTSSYGFGGALCKKNECPRAWDDGILYQVEVYAGNEVRGDKLVREDRYEYTAESSGGGSSDYLDTRDLAQIDSPAEAHRMWRNVRLASHETITPGSGSEPSHSVKTVRSNWVWSSGDSVIPQTISTYVNGVLHHSVDREGGVAGCETAWTRETVRDETGTAVRLTDKQPRYCSDFACRTVRANPASTETACGTLESGDVSTSKTWSADGDRVESISRDGFGSESWSQTLTHDDLSRVVGMSYDGLPWKSFDRTLDGNTGLPISSRSPDGIETSYDWDELGRLTAIDAPGSIEYSTWVLYPTLSETIVHRGPTAPTPTAPAIDAAGDFSQSRFFYDELGRVIESRRRNLESKYDYQQTTYDIAGNVSTQGVWTGRDEFPPPDAATTYVYGTFENPNWDGSDPATRYWIDPLGRASEITGPDGSRVTVAYRGASTVTTVHGIATGYAGGAFTTIDATTTHTKDALGRLVAVDSPGPGADAEYTYDVLDRLTRVELTDPAEPTEVQVRTFTYDPTGRLRFAVHPESGTTEYLSYDARGNLLEYRDADLDTYVQTYDEAGRLLTKSLRIDATSTQPLAAYTYDTAVGAGDGKIASVTSYEIVNDVAVAVSNRTFEYGTATPEVCPDDLTGGGYAGLNGRVREITDTLHPWGEPLVSRQCQNAWGASQLLTYPDREPAPRPRRSRVANTFDNGVMWEVHALGPDFQVLSQIDYDANGAPVKIVRGNGAWTEIDRDEQGRPLRIDVEVPPPDPIAPPYRSPLSQTVGCDGLPEEIQHIVYCGPHGGGSDPQAFQWSTGDYEYDGAGNVRRIGENFYFYDALNRLDGAWVEDDATSLSNVLSYTYDGFGNMVERIKDPSNSSVDSISDFVVDPATNRLQSATFTDVNGQTDVAYGFDARGNLIEDGTRAYDFGPDNRLLAIRDDGETLATYAYDASGYRVRVTEDGYETYYLRDGSGSVLSEFRRRVESTGGAFWDKDYLYALGRAVMLLKNEAPAAPARAWTTGVSATELTLHWDPVIEPDIDYYRIRKTYTQDPTKSSVAVNLPLTSSTSYYDNMIIPPATAVSVMKYEIRGVDQAGNDSVEPLVLLVRPAGDPPPVPPNLIVQPTDRAVDLTWDAVVDDDLAGYVVQRRPVGGSFAVVSGTVPVASNAYRDSGLTNGVAFEYCVLAQDTAGRQSACSSIAAGTPIDNVPPSVPQNVRAAPSLAANSIDIVWDEVIETDLAEYRVYVGPSAVQAASSVTPISPSAWATASYADTSASAGSTYHYRVTAVDDAGNESSHAGIVSARPRDGSIDVPTLTRAEFVVIDVSNNNASPGCESIDHRNDDVIQVELDWYPASLVDGYRVYRKTPEQRVPVLVAELAGGSTASYDDPAVDGIWDAEYFVVAYDGAAGAEEESAVDPAGVLSAFDPFDGTVERVKLTSDSRYTTTNRRSRRVELRWNRVVESQLAGYHIYRRCQMESCITAGGVHDTFLNPEYCDDAWVRLTGFPIVNGTSFWDDQLGGLGGCFAYAIVPVDRNGQTGQMGAVVQAGLGNVTSGTGEITCYEQNAFKIGRERLEPVPPDDYRLTPAETAAYFNALEGTDGDPEGAPFAPADAWIANRGIQDQAGMALPLTSLDERTGFVTIAITPEPEGTPNPQIEWPSDLAGFHVEMAGSPDGPWQRITHAPIMHWSDFGPTSHLHVQGLGVYTSGPQIDPANYIPDQTCTTFRVIAVDEDGLESPPTVVRRYEYAPPPGPCPETPAAPTNLVASTGQSPPSCATSLSWDAVSGASEYHVFRMKLDQSTGGAFFYRTAITTSPSWTETGTGIADGTTNNGVCPYGDGPSGPTCDTGQLDVYYVRARGSSGGLSPRSNMVFWDCSDPGGYAMLDTLPQGAVLAAVGETPVSDSVLPNLGECPIDVTMTSAVSSPLPLDDVRYAALGQAADPDYEIIDLYADHLGSTRVTASDGGVILTRTTYLPFGEAVFPGAADWNTHRFTGHERDDGTGLDYMLARYYGSRLQRFLSPDPIGVFSEPQDWSRFAYSRNNPVAYRDPDGQFWDYVFDAAGLAYDAYELWKNPSWGNAGILVLDVGLGLVPFVPNIGAVRLAAKLGGPIGDIAKRLTNRFVKNLDPATVEAAARQAVGEFDPWRHLQKYDEARRGVTNDLDMLKRMASDPRLSVEERIAAQKLLSQGSKRLDEIEEYFEYVVRETKKKSKGGSRNGPNEYGIDPDGPYGPQPHPCAGKVMCGGI